MVERIRQILETRQLTPTQFADAIGVARPIISHILSGRNKPSLEVVQKIIGAFPELSLPWLLSGIGEMLANTIQSPPVGTPPAQQSVGPSSNKAARSANTIHQVSQGAITTLRSTEEPLTPLFTHSTPLVEPEKASGVIVPGVNVENKTEAVPPVPAVSAPSPSSSNNIETAFRAPEVTQQRAIAAPPASVESVSTVAAFAEPNKAIRRIVIFYQDGTFTDYRPEAS